MTIKRPTLSQLQDIAMDFGMDLSSERASEFLALMQGSFTSYEVVEQLPDAKPEVKWPRTPGYQPWPRRTNTMPGTSKPDQRGALRQARRQDGGGEGQCLRRGVPMMNGASTLEGYVPDIDATIVTRMLDAGATIKGKSHCEFFCFSGGSHTGALGPVINPRKPGYSAGGSSSGSGALVAAGEVDMAIGGDQGGSIRIPAAYCGVYG